MVTDQSPQSPSRLANEEAGGSKLSYTQLPNTLAAVNHDLEPYDKTYLDRLRQCRLDHSLASLERIDILLSKIRHELIELGISEVDFLSQNESQQLLQFIGRYSGQVLAKQWGSTASWRTGRDLKRWARSNNISLDEEDFYQQLACDYWSASSYSAGADHKAALKVSGNNLSTKTKIDSSIPKLFFVLEPIKARLFATAEKGVESILGDEVIGSVFQAVQSRLPKRDIKSVRSDDSQPPPIADLIEVSAAFSVDKIDDLHHENDLDQDSYDSRAYREQNNIDNPSKALDGQLTGAADSGIAAVPSGTDHDPVISLFQTLLQDLHQLPRSQQQGLEQYHQADNILQQIQNRCSDQESLLINDEKSLRDSQLWHQASELLTQAADLGNTTAMLRLAICQLRHQAKITDSALTDVVRLVQKAAGLEDCRAQWLLSKLYYQGVGVSQDISQGRYWGQAAASNGHPEAAALVANWQQIDVLSSIQHQERRSNFRYLLLGGIVGLLALVLVIAL